MRTWRIHGNNIVSLQLVITSPSAGFKVNYLNKKTSAHSQARLFCYVRKLEYNWL